jgi:outer membrane protein assembly factor BamB
MVKHDPQATGRSPYVGPKTANIIWTMDLEYGVFSGPIIDLDGNLYVGTNTWLPQDTTNYFYSVYPKGSLRWTFFTGETFSTNSGYLIGSDSTIYVGSQGGYVYAVDTDDNLKWKNDYGMNIFSHVMNIDLDSSIYFASADGNLYSVYKQNGNVRWKVSYQGGLFSGFAASSPVFSPDGQTIYIAGHDSNLYALNLDGSLKWKFNTGTASVIPVVDNEGNIYFTTETDSFGLHSLNPAGTLRWRYNFDKYNLNVNHYCPAIDKNGNIYFPALHLYGEVSIISIDYNGNFRWEYNFEQQDEDIVVPLICDADGTVYCGSTWGYYYYAISSKGELLWKLPLYGYQVDNSGAIGSDGTLYIGTHLGSLVTGQEKTLIAIRDTVTSVGNENQDIFDFKLGQNYPNPFNSTTHIRYTIPQSGDITVKVYDLLGKEVAVLLDRYQDKGEYDLIFQPDDLPSGVYFYQLQAENFILTKKLILVK